MQWPMKYSNRLGLISLLVVDLLFFWAFILFSYMDWTIRCTAHGPKSRYGWKQQIDGKINNSEEDNGNFAHVISANLFSVMALRAAAQTKTTRIMNLWRVHFFYHVEKMVLNSNRFNGKNGYFRNCCAAKSVFKLFISDFNLMAIWDIIKKQSKHSIRLWILSRSFWIRHENKSESERARKKCA